jgi:hypothetical protein
VLSLTFRKSKHESRIANGKNNKLRTQALDFYLGREKGNVLNCGQGKKFTYENRLFCLIYRGINYNYSSKLTGLQQVVKKMFQK